MDVFGKTIRSLERSLDYAMVKNDAISNNIANVDTPNYKAKQVVFKDVLNETLSNSIVAKRTNPRHIPFQNDISPFQIVTKKNLTYTHNGNNVDIDKEMAELAKNQIYYQSLVDRINGKFKSLENVIREGR